MKRLLISVLLFIPTLTNAKDINPRFFDYSKVDEKIKSVSEVKFESISKLSYFINSEFSTDHERLRAIFRWVTNNIEYKIAYRSSDIYKVFRDRKAVCNGYAELIKVLCDSSNITCRKIVGLAKNNIDFADTDDNRHAWNIVQLYGQEYFIEATWAAGSVNEETGKFIKEYKNHFFLTKPEVFILQHYPDDPEDQLLNKKVSRIDFVNGPIFHEGAIVNEIISYIPSKVLIKTKYKFGYEFYLTALNTIIHIGIKVSYKGKSYRALDPISFEKLQNDYSFWYPFDDYGKYFASIYINNERAITYKIELE